MTKQHYDKKTGRIHNLLLRSREEQMTDDFVYGEKCGEGRRVMTPKEKLNLEIKECSDKIDELCKQKADLEIQQNKLIMAFKELIRIETIEKYKPQLNGYIDKYVDARVVSYPFDVSKNIQCKDTVFDDFDSALDYFKTLKNGGYYIYLYNIMDYPNKCSVSCGAFKE